MSPLSTICSLWWAASLYTSCLFLYSVTDSEILHLISPLCFLMPVYSNLLLALDGQSMTSLISPGGALTLMHPVINAKSSLKCLDKASFHYSRSPLYFRFLMSLVILLYIYSQQDLSGSCGGDDDLTFVGFHISFVLVLLSVVVGGVCYTCTVCVFTIVCCSLVVS
jgi:hypothetical protein